MSDDRPPLHRFTATIKITGDTHDEIRERVEALANNWWYHHTQMATRDEIDSTDGTATVRLEQTNPEQTPENYRAEVTAWMDQRRTVDAP